MKKVVSFTIVLAVSMALLFSHSHATEQKKPSEAPMELKEPVTPTKEIKKTDRVPIPGPVLSCPDLEARLTLTKTRRGSDGIVTLNGQICNVGTADYVSPPLARAHATLAGYDPTRPLTADNYKIIAGKGITNLAKGACMSISGTDTISRVIEWSHRTANSGECQAVREFSLNIGRDVPDDTYFRRNEDCKTANNLIKQSVKYMVQCP